MATRQLGFKLVAVGNDKTISDLDKVGKKLDEVAKKIAAIQNKPIKLSTAFDTKGLNDLLKTLDKVDKAKLNPQIVNTIKELKTQLAGLDKQVNGTQEKLNKVKAPELSEVQIEKINSAFRKVNGSAEEVVATIATLKPKLNDIGTQEALQLAAAIAKVQLNLEKVRGQKLEIKSDKTITDSVKADLLAPLIAQEKELQQQQKELNKSVDLTTRAFVNQANNVPKDSITGLQLELAKLTKQYNLLSKAELESTQGQQLQSKIAGVTNEISDREQAVGNFRRNVGNYQSAIQGLIPKLEELQKEGILAQKELGDIFKGDLIRREQELRAELEKLGNEFKELGTDIKNAGDRSKVLSQIDERVRELTSVRASIDSFGNSFDRLGGKFLRVSDIITGGLIGGGLIGLVTAITQGVKQTVSLNTALADVESDVRKTTGLTADEVKSLTAAFKEIDTRTTTQDLLKIAAVAGQLGVTGTKGVLEFTKSVNVLNVALGDELPGGVDEIASRISKLSNILFGVSTSGEEMAQRMLFIGNTLNVLSASSAATSDKIIDFSARIGRTLAPLGATADQILALSATFDELNILPEQGATAINNLIKDIGANTKLFAQTLEINQDELRQTFNTDPIEAFDLVLRKVLELSGGDNTKALSILKELKQTGEGVSSVFLQLSTNSEIYQRNLKLSNKAIFETSSLFNEFRIKNENLAGVFDKLAKKLQDFATDPNIVKLVDLLGRVLTGSVEVISSVFGGLSSIFERLTSDIGESGTKLEGSFTGITGSALTMSDAQFTVLKSISDVNAILKKEQTIIETSIKIIGDETKSRAARNKAIDTLIEKYPGLISKYQLEGASQKELIELQGELTSTLKREIFNRIKAKTEEYLATKEINLLQRQSELELGGGLTKIQDALSGLFGVREKVVEQEKKNVAKELEDLRLQTEKSVAIFDKTAQKLNINFEETFGNLNYGKVRSNLAGLIKLIEQEIDKNQIDKKTNAILIGVSNSATDIINKLKFDAPESELTKAFESTVGLQKQFEAALKSTTDEQDKSNKLKGLGNEATKEELKATKDIADQLKRIEELKRKIIDLSIEGISNEFDREIAEVKENTRRQVEDIQNELDSLGLKTIKTDADKIEIEKSKELITALKETEVAAVEKINAERAKVLKAAAKELENTRREVLQIISEINQTEINVKIDEAKFDLEQAERKIEIKFQANVDELTKQLDSGLISQEEFNKESELLEAEKLDEISALYDGFEAEQRQRLQRLFDAEKYYLSKTYQAKRQNIQDQLQLDLQELNSDLREGRIDRTTATELRAEKIKKATAEIKKLDADYAKDKIKLEQDLTNNLNALTDAQTEAHRSAEQERTKITGEEKKRRKELRRQELEEAARIAKEEGFALVQSISDALFEIEEANNEKAFDSQRQRIEKNYENQIKAAQGNTAEVERLEREKAQKIDQLDKQQNEKRKKAAINKAIIDSSLAIIKAFSELGPIAGAIAAIFIGAQTAIQINKIKRTTFAKGGHVRHGGFTGGSIAPPDETGERPVDAQLHYGEFVSTRKQVNKNNWLYQILEADRQRTNAGSSTDLEQKIADTIAMRRRAVYNLSSPTRRRFEPVIPVIIPTGSSHKTELNISDEQIDRIAEAIADKVYQGSTKGTSEGTTEGIIKATKEALRSERTNLRKVI